MCTLVSNCVQCKPTAPPSEEEVMELIFKMLLLTTQYEVLFGLRNTIPKSRHIVRIHLEDDERLIIPNKYRPLSTVKILRPVTSHKFYTIEPSSNKINKKGTTKNHHVKHSTSGDSKFKSTSVSDEANKKCCGNEWVSKGKEVIVPVPLEDLFRPVSLPTAQQIQGYRNTDDIKPVTEHIEDDFKYDFRTKTHSF